MPKAEPQTVVESLEAARDGMRDSAPVCPGCEEGWERCTCVPVETQDPPRRHAEFIARHVVELMVKKAYLNGRVDGEEDEGVIGCDAMEDFERMALEDLGLLEPEQPFGPPVEPRHDLGEVLVWMIQTGRAVRDADGDEWWWEDGTLHCQHTKFNNDVVELKEALPCTPADGEDWGDE